MPYSSNELIHADSKIVDLQLVTRDKNYLLNRIQFWKNFLREKQLKSIMLLQHTTIDSIAIVFACAEVGVKIYTSPIGPSEIEKKAPLVDFIFIGSTYVIWFDTNTQTTLFGKEILVLDEKLINQQVEKQNYKYESESIDPNNILIVGDSSGSTGPAKLISHTNNTFVQAAQNSHHLFDSGDVFASHNGINHIGFLAVTMIAPLFKGVTIYTINYLHEMIIFTTRGFLTKVALYESHLMLIKSIPGLGIQNNCLKDCAVISAGGPVSPKFVDEIFSLGARQFTSFYGCNETLSPFFTLTLNSNNDPFDDGRVGKLVPEAEYKIINDQLHIKTPSISPSVSLDNEGYYNTSDYATERNEQVIYLGRQLFDNGSKRVFSRDIVDQIQSIIGSDKLYFTEYHIDYSGDDVLGIYVLTDIGYQVLNTHATEITGLLAELLGNQNLKLAITKVPTTDPAFFGRKITLSLIKQVLTKQSD